MGFFRHEEKHKITHASWLKPVLLSVIVGSILQNATKETKKSKLVTKPKQAKQNAVQKLVNGIDSFQQRHGWAGLPYAVIKKYGDDEAGYQGALVTYYGFLSLFPLLIVATSIIDLATRHNDALRTKLFSSIDQYLPVVGDQLQSSVHGSSKTGVALVIGLIVTFFGARGVADAVRHALNHVWEVPKQHRAGFPKNMLKSLSLIAGAGLGFAAAQYLSALAAATLGHSFIFHFLPVLASFVMLLGVFLFIFRIAPSAKHSLAQLLPGATFAALGQLVLQTLGAYLVRHQLHNLKGAYGQFGLVLAILFWIYLQAEVFLYAAEINTVRTLKLWPRSLTQNPLTEADRKAFELYAQRETYKSPPQEVNVKFTDKR